MWLDVINNTTTNSTIDSSSAAYYSSEFWDELGDGCHKYIDGVPTSYGYVPSEAAGIAFLVLFGVSLLLHIGQSVYSRSWWYLVFAVGNITEIIGWGARTWSSQCPYVYNAFLMQITTLIIAPVFYTAGIYVILGQMIIRLGRTYSPIGPRQYLYIFCTCDFISLVVQAIGGGIASGANTLDQTNLGTHIMVAGIVFQLATITLFCYFFARLLWKCRSANVIPNNIKLVIAATIISIIMIYIRSIYRTIELMNGWSGYYITHEKYFLALDGAMMVVAVGIFNVFHPGLLLPKKGEEDNNKVQVEMGNKNTMYA